MKHLVEYLYPSRGGWGILQSYNGLSPCRESFAFPNLSGLAEFDTVPTEDSLQGLNRVILSELGCPSPFLFCSLATHLMERERSSMVLYDRRSYSNVCVFASFTLPFLLLSPS